MSLIVEGIDSVLALFDNVKASRASSKKSLTTSVGAGYFLFFLAMTVVYHKFSDGGWSSILTASAGVQCLGFLMLTLKVMAQRSVSGLSCRTLEIYALALTLKLMSTTTCDGYIPVDRSGDHIYQFADALSLLLVAHLLWCARSTHASTYQAVADKFSILPLVLPCFVAAMFIHNDLNNWPLFDKIWYASLNLDAVAMIPQLWLMTKESSVEGMTSHFVALLTASRVFSFIFWFHGYAELAHSADDLNISGKWIVGAHFLQLLVAADFMYYYIKACAFGHRLMLPV